MKGREVSFTTSLPFFYNGPEADLEDMTQRKKWHKSYGIMIFVYLFVLLNICCAVSNAENAMVWVKKGQKVTDWPSCVICVRNIPKTNIFRVKFSALPPDDSGSECLNIIRNLKEVDFVEETKPILISDSIGGRANGTACNENLVDKDLLNTLGTGKNIVVAVIDTGISLSIYGGYIKKNNKEIFGDGIDNDSNGYIDDYQGWDFGDMDSTPLDNEGHGTEVSSVLLSVAPEISILPVKVTSGTDVSFSTGDAAEAIYYAVSRGANVINMSFSADDFSYAIYSAVLFAVNSGCTIIAAAGNDGGEVNFPASMAEVIAAGSSDASGLPSWFSSFGTGLDMLAPGEDVCTTGLDGSVASASGTSFATPVISGVAAVLLSMNPYLTPGSVKKILIKGTKDILDPGWDIYSGYGDINAKDIAASATPSVDIPDQVLKGTLLNVGFTLPPTDTSTDVFFALIFNNTAWWLDSTGSWHRADEDAYAPFMQIYSNDFVSKMVYGQGGTSGDAINTAFHPPGNYLWAIGIFDKNGNMLAPVGWTNMKLDN